MNTYERLQDEACEDGIDVIDYTFHSDRIKVKSTLEERS